MKLALFTAIAVIFTASCYPGFMNQGGDRKEDTTVKDSAKAALKQNSEASNPQPAVGSVVTGDNSNVNIAPATQPAKKENKENLEKNVNATGKKDTEISASYFAKLSIGWVILFSCLGIAVLLVVYMLWSKLTKAGAATDEVAATSIQGFAALSAGFTSMIQDLWGQMKNTTDPVKMQTIAAQIDSLERQRAEADAAAARVAK